MRAAVHEITLKHKQGKGEKNLFHVGVWHKKKKKKWKANKCESNNENDGQTKLNLLE